MKNYNKRVRKMLVLVAAIVAAGFCYSCGMRGEAVSLTDEPGNAAVRQWSDAAGKMGGSPDARAEDAAEAGEAFDKTLTDDLPESQADEEKRICLVHVCGEVNSPGVYELEEGARIVDAVALAGGFTEEAAADYLNLAEQVQDGKKVNVPNRNDVPKQAWQPERIGADSSGSSGQARIDLNTATKEELMKLRGIGEARAEDIIRYRESHGRFQKIEDIMKISGIKDAAFQKIKEDITVSP